MPTKVETLSELSVAFGVLGILPDEVSDKDQLRKLFLGERPFWNEFIQFRQSFENESTSKVFFRLGRLIREEIKGNVTQVEWYGPNRQASTSSSSRDLRLCNVNWSVSVKDESDVVANSSPHNLFVAVPSGETKTKDAKNWFRECAPNQYLELLHCAINRAVEKNIIAEEDVQLYIENPRKLQTEKVIDRIKAEYGKNCRLLYIQMCHEVATVSARLFEESLQKGLKKSKNGIYEGIMRQFLRVNGERYMSAGIEKDGTAYLLEIPSIDDLRKTYRVERITAVPELDRKQSVVKFELTMTNITTSKSCQLNYHAEIRWSHGAFCGNPEAKLYKDFRVSEVPFFKQIYKENSLK